MPITISSVTFTATGESIIELEDSVGVELIVVLHTPQIDAAPSAITVSVLDAYGTEDIEFEIGGSNVFQLEPDPDGNLELATIPVPDLKDGNGDRIMLAGMHDLTVTQGSATGTVEFEILNDPAEVPEQVEEDAPPAAVPGAVQPNGVQRWVFQDPKPSGLGSWVMPMNPVEMTSPAFVRGLSAKPSTSGETFHVSEDAYSPVEWTFSGVCPTEEMRDKLEAYDDLNRRWYLHDHRGRAWKVVAQDLQLTPRLTMNWNGVATDEGHEYEMTVLVIDKDWVEVDYT